MSRIRICWAISQRVALDAPLEYGHSGWVGDVPTKRKFFETMVISGDAEHGRGSHWLEESPVISPFMH